MRRVLLDESVPVGVAGFLTRHAVKSVPEMGWASLIDGDMIEAAEKEGFEVVITCDQNLRYQQNLSRRKLAWVVLKTNSWKSVRINPALIVKAVNDARPGSWIELTFQRPVRIA